MPKLPTSTTKTPLGQEEEDFGGESRSVSKLQTLEKAGMYQAQYSGGSGGHRPPTQTCMAHSQKGSQKGAQGGGQYLREEMATKVIYQLSAWHIVGATDYWVIEQGHTWQYYALSDSRSGDQALITVTELRCQASLWLISPK